MNHDDKKWLVRIGSYLCRDGSSDSRDIIRNVNGKCSITNNYDNSNYYNRNDSTRQCRLSTENASTERRVHIEHRRGFNILVGSERTSD